MSLYTVVKSVMDGNGWPAVTTSVSASQDQNMRQTVALANRALKATSYKRDWPILVREYEFDTVASQESYPLPPDFHHLVAPSAWNADQYYGLKGSMPPQKWFARSLTGGIDWPNGFRIDPSSKMFRIAPLPSGPDKLVFMYVTTYIAKDAGGIPVTQYTQDSDESVVDENLVELDLTWRWRQKKGLDYTAEMAEYSGTFNRRLAQELAYGEIQIGAMPYHNYPLTQPTVPPVFGS